MEPRQFFQSEEFSLILHEIGMHITNSFGLYLFVNVTFSSVLLDIEFG